MEVKKPTGQPSGNSHDRRKARRANLLSMFSKSTYAAWQPNLANDHGGVLTMQMALEVMEKLKGTA